jgi:hypothetical protein
MASTRTAREQVSSSEKRVTRNALMLVLLAAVGFLHSLGNPLKRMTLSRNDESLENDDAFPEGSPGEDQWNKIARETEPAVIREFEKGNQEVHEFYEQNEKLMRGDSGDDQL